LLFKNYSKILSLQKFHISHIYINSTLSQGPEASKAVAALIWLVRAIAMFLQ